MSKDFVLTSAVIAGAHSPSTTAAITWGLRTGIVYARRSIGKAVDVLAPATSRVSYEAQRQESHTIMGRNRPQCRYGLSQKL